MAATASVREANASSAAAVSPSAARVAQAAPEAPARGMSEQVEADVEREPDGGAPQGRPLAPQCGEVEEGHGADEHERRRGEVDAQHLGRGGVGGAVDDRDRRPRRRRHAAAAATPAANAAAPQAHQRAAQVAVGPRRGEPRGDRQEHQGQRAHDRLRRLEQPGARLVGRDVGVGSQQPEQRGVDAQLDHGQEAEAEQRQRGADHAPPGGRGRAARPVAARQAPGDGHQPDPGREVGAGHPDRARAVRVGEPDAHGQRRPGGCRTARCPATTRREPKNTAL